jgi:hypothetical protein
MFHAALSNRKGLHVPATFYLQIHNKNIILILKDWNLFIFYLKIQFVVHRERSLLPLEKLLDKVL